MSVAVNIGSPESAIVVPQHVAKPYEVSIMLNYFSLGMRIQLIDLHPIYYVPPRLDVVSSGRSELFVICMLPHIDSQNWNPLTGHQRIVLVC